MRYLFHIARARDLSWGADGRYAAASLATEGFVHASFRDAVLESARLYFRPDDELRVLVVDPRRLDVPVEIAETPRGPMPHVHGTIPADAVRVLSLEEVPHHADAVAGTRIGFVAFAGMTLLDLVGPLDAVSRIAKMGEDPETTCEVVALTRPAGDPTVLDVPVWSDFGLHVVASRYRPALDAFDVLVVPGGLGTRALVDDAGAIAYLQTFPANRLVASVCTGALLLGAAGRLTGKRATTHARYLDALARYGARAEADRVVDDGEVITAGGVTAGIDLGLHLVARLAGDEARARIAAQMETR